MNIIKFNEKKYKYESFWREDKEKKITDAFGDLLPYPEENEKKWQNQDLFFGKLKETEENLKRRNKFVKYEKEKYKDCLLCDQKNITKGLYEINKIRWEEGLKHYIEVHNIKPSDKFIDTVFRFRVGNEIRSISRLADFKGKKVKKYNTMYLKLDRNQLNIMDALMRHGGYKNYYDNKKSFFRYSEHAGLLDFNDDGLEKIVVSGNTNRVDELDDDIFLPSSMVDMYDYEFIFHTHPPTPVPGGRAKDGILYEFPSISDIFHFIDHFNDGNTQGSIVMTAEGMYIIRKFEYNDKKININENNFFKETMKQFFKLQEEAIKKYGINFNSEKFYSVIAQDTSYIDRLNKVLNKYEINIDFYSRKKDKQNKWIVDTIYLPMYVIEPV
jgi:hypothetical protein